MKKLFGTDGIRGEVGTKIQVYDVLKVAIASGIFFRKINQEKQLSKYGTTNKILIGKDTRRSGYMIENAIVSGLTAIGFDVIQIGPMPTPTVAFLTENMRCNGGIMISASHNSYEDNGIKFFHSNGKKLSKEEEGEIEALFFQEEELFKACQMGKFIGSSKRIDDVIGRYIVHIKNAFPQTLNLNNIRIVIDTANGAGYKVAPTILQELGAEVFVINDSPNGININSDCGALHPKALQAEVLKVRADIGIALDGDADRLTVVDEEGELIDGDNIIASIALYLKTMNKLKNDAVITTQMSNGALKEFLNSKDIAHHSSDVGDRNVTEMMQHYGSNFGGEESGHIILSDYSTTGDGLLSSLQALAIIVSSGKKSSEALRQFKPFNRKTLNLSIQEKKELNALKGYDELLQEIERKNIRHLIRYSGTENRLRLLLEGDCDSDQLAQEMERLKQFFTKALSD